MTVAVYDATKTAADILIDYNQHLRTEVVDMTDDEINELITRLETCADNTHGPKRHQDIDRFIEVCRSELDDRDLVRCLVRAELVADVTFVEAGNNE